LSIQTVNQAGICGLAKETIHAARPAIAVPPRSEALLTSGVQEGAIVCSRLVVLRVHDPRGWRSHRSVPMTIVSSPPLTGPPGLS
jgi:hypothetical protein